MDKCCSIRSRSTPDVALRMINVHDQDNLREWKNQHRDAFFFRDLILPAAQRAWFENYLTRQHDFMFMAEVDGHAIGCMGIRLLEDRWDVYNVILGAPEFVGRGFMAKAIRLMCSHAVRLNPLPVTAKVLVDNPALGWYLRNAFSVTANHGDHVDIALDRSKFELLDVEVTGASSS